MSDPVLDEHEIFQDLHTPVTTQSVSRLQMACVGAMCDLYDRKVTRDQYVAMLGPCISLYGAMAKLYIASNIRIAFRKGECTEDALNEAIAKLEDAARSHAGHVQQIMVSLMSCPSSQDPIH